MKKLYLVATLFFLASNLSAQIITSYTAASTKGGLCNNEVNTIVVEKNNTGRWRVGTNNGITGYYGFFNLITKQDTLERMKDNCIHALVDDTQFEWVCTNGGVVKSNIGGGSIQNYTTTDGLIDNHVNAAAVDASGNKWFGTDNGISRFTNTIWTSYTIADGLVDNHVNAVAIDKDGSKWFGTNNGLSRFDGTAWITYTINEGLVDNHVNAIAIDKNGIKWITTNNGISRYDGIVWTTYNTNNGLVNNMVRAVAIDTGNNPWFGTEGGVTSLNTTTTAWTTYTTANGLVNNNVHAITIDSNNGKSFGTYGGLSKFDGTTWTTYTTNGLPTDICMYTAVDSHNNKWFTSICGVAKFDGITWTTYNNANSGLLSDQILSIDTQANGSIWIGTRKGASSFDGTSWTSYTPSNGLPDVNMFGVFFDKQGNKWFATALGVTKFDGTTWTTYTTANGLVNNTVTCITQDVQGKMWFGTANGISRFDGTTWTSFGGGNITKIVVDAQDNKWIGTYSGVMKYNNIGFTTYHTTQYIPSNGVIDLTIDLQGNIWFVTNSGMAKFDGSNWTTYTTSTNALLGYNLEAIAVDLDGIKWLCVSQRGIVKFDDRFVTLSGTNLALPAEANSAGSVAITSNTRWTVSTNQSWLNVSATSGTANGSISLTATANPTTSDRTATVTITSSDLSTKTVTVTQAGRILVPQPLIGIQGNSVTISKNGNTPSFADQTNFGSAEVTNGTATSTFSIQNTGEGALTFPTSTAAVTISGANASDFSVTSLPAPTIVAGGSGSFAIQFDPSAEGTRSATVSVWSNDTTQNPYTFTIQGEGVLGRDVVVSGITNPATANGVYTYQGIQNEFQYWKNTISGYYIYNKAYQGYRSWNIDVDNDDTHVSFFANDHLEDASPVHVAVFTMERGSGAAGIPVINYLTTVPTIPNAPIIGTATARDSRASISFTAPASDGGSPLTDYTVTSNTGIQGHGAASPVIVSGLTNGNGYYFTVTAWNSVGESVSSAVSNVVVPFTAPTALTEAANAITTSGATLHGTVNANGASTVVSFEYGTTTAYGSSVIITQSPLTGILNTLYTVPITGAANTTYHYRVVAVNAAGTTYGMDQTFSTSVTTGQDAPEAFLTLYPNPATDGFNIHVGEKPTLISICDLNGTLVLKQLVSGNSYIDIRSLQQGMYVVRANGLVTKLVKK